MIEQFATAAARDVRSAAQSVQSSSVKKTHVPRLSVHQATTHRWSFLDDLITYQSLGFRSAGLWRPKLGQFGEEKAVELIRDTGLSISSLSWAGGFTGANEESFDDAVADARDALGLAGALGAECLVLVSGPRTVHIRSHARRLLVHAIQELADAAKEHRVTLALQPMHRGSSANCSFLHSLDETLDVINECGSSAPRIAFDAYHLWQEPRLLDRIREIAPSVALVQLSDGRAPCAGDEDRCLPGDGQIPLAEIVHAFGEAGYAGYYEMSIWSERLWRRDYRELLCECRERFYDLFCGPRVPLPSLE